MYTTVFSRCLNLTNEVLLRISQRISSRNPLHRNSDRKIIQYAPLLILIISQFLLFLQILFVYNPYGQYIHLDGQDNVVDASRYDRF